MKNIFTKIIIALIVVLVLGGGFYYFVLFPNKKDNHGCLYNKGYIWCDFKQKCIKGEEDCDLTPDWVLNEAKKIIGLDLNIMPYEIIKWNTEEGESVFLAKGIYYLDFLDADIILNGFNSWNEFLNQSGFETDLYNPPVTDEKETILNYAKESITCVLKKTNNIGSSTSSLSLSCGNMADQICSFDSDCGKECANDNDCGLITNGCAKRIVCRNKNYKFYDNCPNPTSKLDDLDISIVECICLENECVPKNEEHRHKN